MAENFVKQINGNYNTETNVYDSIISVPLKWDELNN